LIAAPLYAPVNNQQMIRHSAGSASVSEIKARTPRYFLKSIYPWNDLGAVDGFQGVSRMRLGRAVSRIDLEPDCTMTHELVHMAIASLADEHHRLEEGLATYVEPIARSQDGQLSAGEVWVSMASGMAQGEPRRGGRGLDLTHTWSHILGRGYVLSRR
jgi:hypothetical protein